jgi:hypothetical protein
MAEGKPCIVMPDSAGRRLRRGLLVRRQILGRVWLAAGLAGLGTMLAISVKDVGAEGDRSASQSAAPAPQTPAPAGRGASPFVPPEPLDYADRSGWTSLFDGRTLAGWSGNPEVWSVENGAITATSTAERRVGLQIEMFGLGKVNVREIWLKQFRP